MLARGDNVSNVSRAFGCHRNTIIRLRQRFQQTGGVADRRRLGRPSVTNLRTDRFITLTHLRPRFQTATSSARQYGINKQTVLLRLRQARQPIRPRRPIVGQVLTERHRDARLQWTQRHLRWGRQPALSAQADEGGEAFLRRRKKAKACMIFRLGRYTVQTK